ncbi:hypothetical protein H8959_017979 [Pygathrix nigripes]
MPRSRRRRPGSCRRRPAGGARSPRALHRPPRGREQAFRLGQYEGRRVFLQSRTSAGRGEFEGSVTVSNGETRSCRCRFAVPVGL